jgi:hypothetical protein
VAGSTKAATAAAAAADRLPDLATVWLTLQPSFAFLLVADATYDSSSSSSGRGALLPQQPSAGLAAARQQLLAQLLGVSGSAAAAAGLVVPLVLAQLSTWRADAGADRCVCVCGGGGGVIQLLHLHYLLVWGFSKRSVCWCRAQQAGAGDGAFSGRSLLQCCLVSPAAQLSSYAACACTEFLCGFVACCSPVQVAADTSSVRCAGCPQHIQQQQQQQQQQWGAALVGSSL